MKAKLIKENNVFKPKEKETILKSFINVDTALPLIEALTEVMSTVPKNYFTYEEMRGIAERLSVVATDFFNDVRLEEMLDDVNESVTDVLKPKNKEDILNNLRNTDYTEYELQNGRRVWVYEDSFKDHGGEQVFFHTIVDENGKKEFLDNEALSRYPFYQEDRMELVKKLDNYSDLSSRYEIL